MSSKLKVFTEPTLVGREQELAQLNQYLELLKSGKGLTVFVSGEAGSGKTKLAREFLNAAAKKGTTVLSGWCLSDAAVPYFPFVTAFDNYFGTMEEDPIGNTVMGQGLNLGPHLTSSVPTAPNAFGITTWLTGLRSPQIQQASSPQVWKDQVFSAIGKTLQQLAEQTPIIFFIEDIHWADSASLGLLHYLSRIICNERIMLLATFRSEELTADVDGRPHPLAELIRLIKREEIYSEIRLLSLSQQEITKIFSNMLGGNPQNSLVEKLSDESHGNALFLIESLRMLTERKSLIQEGDSWRLAEYEIGIPSKVKDIILRRLGILKFNQRRVLDAASVIGEKFDIELLSSLLSQDSLELLETLNFIARSTSLVFAEGNCYRFDHATSRETIYEEIPVPLKRGYHNRIAERLETTAKQGNLPLSDLAHHYAQADSKEKALKFAMSAANDEYARFSNVEAAKHFKYVLDKLPDTPEQKLNKLKAMEGLGDAYYAMSFLNEAEKIFDQLLTLEELPAVRLRVAKKSMLCAYWLGNIQNALAKGTIADEYASADPLEFARLQLHRGFIIGRTGNNVEAIKDMEKALAVFEREPNLWDTAQALVELTFAYRMVGKLVSAFTAGLRSVHLFVELNDLRGQGLAYSRLAGPFNSIKYQKEALEYLSLSIKFEEKVGDYNLLALHYWAIAETFEELGDLKEAVSKVLQGIEIAERVDAFYVLSLCYGVIIEYYSHLKDFTHAEEYEHKFEKLLADVPTLRNNRNAVALKIRGHLSLLVAKGKFKEAFELAQDLKKELAGNTLQETGLLLAIGKMLVAQGKTEEGLEKIRFAKATFQRSLDEIEQVSLQAVVMVPKQVDVGEDFRLRIDFVSFKQPIKLLKINGLISQDFKIIEMPAYCILIEKQIIIEKEELKSFSVEPLNITLRAPKSGEFKLTPTIEYKGSSEELKQLGIQPFSIVARSIMRMKIGNEVLPVPILPNRISTGFYDLDTLLFGGIPEGYSIILASPSIDEKDLLVKRFLESGAQNGELAYYITNELNLGKALAEKYPQNLQLFACSTLADSVIKNMPNVFKLKGTENLTEIDIALTKALRSINPTNAATKRICIDIISDVLLQHHALITRKWLSGILPMLKNKGFTVLAVINQQMHQPEESQAVQGLFDGEIGVAEKETITGLQKTLRVRRLYNQKFLENEITINNDKLQ